MQVDMLRSSPACSHRRSAPKVGNHTGTVPSETCGSNNMPSIIYPCLDAAHMVSLRAGRHRFSQRLDADLKPTTLLCLPTLLHHLPALQHFNNSTPVTPGDNHPSFSCLPSFLSELCSGRLPGCKESMRGKDRPWLCSLNTAGAVWQGWP